MTRRLWLHPGFHKTGTSSIQHFLWSNRAALADRIDLVLLRHLRPVVQAFCRFSRTGSAAELIDTVDHLDTAFAKAGADGSRDIVLSCEGLSGHLPGYPGVDSYALVPVLTATLAGYVVERLPDVRPGVIFTTREAEPWLWSAWRHHLKGQRLTEDWEAFRTRLSPSADLDAVIAQVAQAVDPLPVRMLPLERAAAHPLGPGGAFLEALDYRVEGLDPVGHGNPGPKEAVWQDYLALNRSDLSPADIRARKDALARENGLGGWQRT